MHRGDRSDYRGLRIARGVKGSGRSAAGAAQVTASNARLEGEEAGGGAQQAAALIHQRLNADAAR
jgi:hypothetical protein